MLTLFCLIRLYNYVSACAGAAEGRVIVSVRATEGEELVRRGAGEAAGMITLPEQVYVTGELAETTTGWIAAMAYMHYVPAIAALALTVWLMVNLFRERVFAQVNYRLLLAIGVIMLAAPAIAVLANGWLIPAIVKGSTNDVMEVGVNLAVLYDMLYGAIALVGAFVLEAGIKRNDSAKE